MITGVNDSGNKLSLDVDTGDEAVSQILIDSLTGAINFSPVITTPEIINQKKSKKIPLLINFALDSCRRVEYDLKGKTSILLS
jgi:hypothetical protein